MEKLCAAPDKLRAKEVAILLSFHPGHRAHVSCTVFSLHSTVSPYPCFTCLPSQGPSFYPTMAFLDASRTYTQARLPPETRPQPPTAKCSHEKGGLRPTTTETETYRDNFLFHVSQASPQFPAVFVLQAPGITGDCTTTPQN